MKIVFKSKCGETSYEDSHITLEEIQATKELLEYENECEVFVYIEN